MGIIKELLQIQLREKLPDSLRWVTKGYVITQKDSEECKTMKSLGEDATVGLGNLIIKETSQLQ